MADAVDDDTLAAVRALWQAVPSLPALTDRPPGAFRLKSPRAQPLPLPYAHVACEAQPGKGRRYVKGQRLDVRKVTLTFWGSYRQCKDMLALTLAVFNSRMGGPEGVRPLEYPSGARLHKWWPLGDGGITQDDAVKGGQDVWRMEVAAEVWSVRAES